MRGSGSWNAGIYEAAKMSSVHEVSAQGSDASIVITRVHTHPQCERVEFWAKFTQEGAADYLRLAKEIQSPDTLFREFDGNPGDHCLAQKDGIWYRARIVSQNTSQYVVYLIDKGLTYSTNSSMLTCGKKEHFDLPPEVEFCVLANALPLSADNRWSPLALEFLKSLAGRSVKVHVQNFLMMHRMFILNIPCVSKQLFEMGFARKISVEMFEDFLMASLQCKRAPQLQLEPQSVVSMETGELLHKNETFMYPELQAGAVEMVVITEVRNPHRIFCQLKVFSHELNKLSEQLTQCCDCRTATCTIGPDMIGFPCAARGSDGKWYRSILQQVFPANKVVEVLFVDHGIKQMVQVENVRSLASEFFRMPVMTYSCSLHGIIDQGRGWTTSQIDYLRALVLCKTIIAKFEYRSIAEGVYYVTLYGDENLNINQWFGSKESCLLECEKALKDFAIRTSDHNRDNTTRPLKEKKRIDMDNVPHSHLPSVENLPIKSTHVAFVQFVLSPSEFWVQTQNFSKELDEMMDKMATLYQKDPNSHVIPNPTVGVYCAAKAEDGEYYRAIVTEVDNEKVTVFFVDFGNSAAVDMVYIKELRDDFRKLPQLALKCSLVNVGPKSREWSHETCDEFAAIVLDKPLKVHVTDKAGSWHFVQLTDPGAAGEKDIAKLLCAANFAEKDVKMPPKGKTSSQFISSAQYTGASFEPQNVVCDVNERKGETFKKQMFTIGSTLDVNVSWIESPNDFWCQLVQSAGLLKLLMYDIQTRYRNSKFQAFVEPECVARHPENGMWYRALIVKKHETPHVDVLFIDYGQMETVSLFDLRQIEKDFLLLPGQAFRCSLLNPVGTVSAFNNWTDEALDRLVTFVESAANGFVILKCTIYAAMYNEQNIVCNVVDLETPFESICTSLANLVISAPQVTSAPPFSLDTYYYSTLNVKMGSEEQVILTSVKDVSHFFCQLRRNAAVLEDLQLKVDSLCELLQRANVPSVFGKLCFAKYSDGHWYRGQIKATKPSILVHFVDFGDTLEVGKSDLLPIPKEASEIMAVPVQALLCGLSDIPDNISEEANRWFESSAAGCEFKARIIAKESNGKLVVELYQGTIQVNSKIKKLFELEMHSEVPVVCQDRPGQMFPDVAVKLTQKRTNTSPMQAFVELDDAKQCPKDHISFVPKSFIPKNTSHTSDKKLHLTPKPCRNAHRNQQLYEHPHQRKLPEKYTNETPKYTTLPHQPKQTDRGPPFLTKPTQPKLIQQHTISTTESWITNNDVPPAKLEKLPKLTDLPQRSITSDMVTEVYISHTNGPSSFYVQLVKEEDDILSIVEMLNKSETTSKSNITEVHAGDLVQAEFTDDSYWYRAVVKEKTDKATALVEFVDYGNTASVLLSKMRKLDKCFLQYPAYSTHCMLKSAAALEKDQVMMQEVKESFETAIGGVGEKQLKCKFIQLSGTVWEVALEDEGFELECEISVNSKSENTQVTEVNNALNMTKVSTSTILQFKQQKFQQGQQLHVFITAMVEPHIFWCQYADSEELDQICKSIAAVGDAENCVSLNAFSVGSPCIALYSEDQLWYRAEVLNTTGSEVCLLFVDYGDELQVKPSAVRKVTPEMIQNPMQAFLCELEGFDSSEGSWEIGAEDELSALTADQRLLLTVCKVSKDVGSGKPKCYVHLECDGQVINQKMRTFWRSHVSEVDLTKSESHVESQSLVCVDKAVTPENSQDVEACDNHATGLPSGDKVGIVEVLKEDQARTTGGSSQIIGEHTKAFDDVIEDVKQVLTKDAQAFSEDSLTSFDVPVEEAEVKMCSTYLRSQIPERLEVDISAIVLVPSDGLDSDFASGETVLYCTDDECEDLSSNYEERLNKDIESVMDSTGIHDLSSPLDNCFLEVTGGSCFPEPFESLRKEARHDLDIRELIETTRGTANPEMFISAARPVSVSPVPCLFLDSLEHLTLDENLDESQLIEDFFTVPSSVLPKDSFDSDLGVEIVEDVYPGNKRSPSVTSAQMVPRSDFRPTVLPSPEGMREEPTEEFQQGKDLSLLSSDVFPHEFLNFHQKEKTPEPCSGSSPSLNEDLFLFPENDASHDLLDFEHNTGTQTKVIPKSTSSPNLTSDQLEIEDLLLVLSDEPHLSSFEAEAAPEEAAPEIPSLEMAMNEVLLTLCSTDVTSQDSPDINEDIENPDVFQGADAASASSREADKSPSNVNLLCDFSDDSATAEDQGLLLSLSDVLPENSKLLEQEFGAQALSDESTCAKTDWLAELSTHCEDLWASGDTSAIESQVYAVTSTEKAKDVSLLDLCSGDFEHLSLSDANCGRGVTEEETMDERPPVAAVPRGQQSVLNDVESAAEPDDCSSLLSTPFPPMTQLAECVSLEEQAVCDGGEAADVSAESESMEHFLTEDFGDSESTLTEESSLDISVEEVLSTVTHLSLVVENGSEDDQSAE